MNDRVMVILTVLIYDHGQGLYARTNILSESDKYHSQDNLELTALRLAVLDKHRFK